MAVSEQKRATISLPKDDRLLITRRFDATPDLVYRAYTTPDLVRRWWCGKRGEVTTCEIDPEERLVSTEVFEAMPEHEAVCTASFTGSDGGTVLTLLVQHPTKELRDQHLASGMEEGMNEALDLLEELARPGGPAGLAELEVLVGSWDLQTSFEAGALGPDSPAATIAGGKTTFEWLDGRFF